MNTLQEYEYWVKRVEEDKSDFSFLIDHVRAAFYSRNDTEMLLDLITEFPAVSVKVVADWRNGKNYPKDIQRFVSFFNERAIKFLKQEMVKARAQLDLCRDMIYKVLESNQDYFHRLDGESVYPELLGLAGKISLIAYELPRKVK